MVQLQGDVQFHTQPVYDFYILPLRFKQNLLYTSQKMLRSDISLQWEVGLRYAVQVQKGNFLYFNSE